MGPGPLLAASLLAFSAVAAPAGGRVLQQGCEPLLSVVQSTPSLSTFVDLGRNVTIAAPADGEQYTILAPSNAAFQALGAEALATLLLPENLGVLTTILRDHILPDGAFLASDFIAEGSAEYATLNPGFSDMVEAAGGTVTVTAPDNGTVATVVEADLVNCAGVIHVIDTVLVRGGPDNEMSGMAPAEMSGMAPADVVTTALGPGGAFADSPDMSPMGMPPMEAMAPMGAYGGYGGYGESPAMGGYSSTTPDM